MNITLTTTPEFLERLEALLMRYEIAISDHLYNIWMESDIRKIQNDIAIMQDELSNLITQAQIQIIANSEDGQ
jgi:hypothetical protein